MRKLIVRFSGLFVLIGFATISLAAQTTVGYVVELEGNWVLNGSNALSVGEKLPADGAIRLRNPSRYDRITIHSGSGELIASRNCGSEDCSRAIKMPAAKASTSILGIAFDKVMEAIWGSPERYAAYRNRSGDIADGVVKLTGGNVDLSSILKTQGEQYLRWRMIQKKESDVADWTKPVKLDKSAQVAGFQPGLYEISLVRSNGSNFEPIAASWILVAGPADYEKTQVSFQSAQALTKKWGDKVQPVTVQKFLHASLDNLAQQTLK